MTAAPNDSAGTTVTPLPALVWELTPAGRKKEGTLDSDRLARVVLSCRCSTLMLLHDATGAGTAATPPPARLSSCM
eukprot:COSAG05_NODE_331_length_11273_cov_3.896635_3_plen_76_part_00